MFCDRAARGSVAVGACLLDALDRPGGRVPGVSVVPESTASTTAPQNTADLVFGLMSIGTRS